MGARTQSGRCHTSGAEVLPSGWSHGQANSEGKPPLALFMLVICTKRRGRRPETLTSVTRRAFPVTLTGDLVIAAGDPDPESVTIYIASGRCRDTTWPWG